VLRFLVKWVWVFFFLRKLQSQRGTATSNTAREVSNRAIFILGIFLLEVLLSSQVQMQKQYSTRNPKHHIHFTSKQSISPLEVIWIVVVFDRCFGTSSRRRHRSARRHL
jgi:hypothetical protein